MKNLIKIENQLIKELERLTKFEPETPEKAVKLAIDVIGVVKKLHIVRKMITELTK